MENNNYESNVINDVEPTVNEDVHVVNETKNNSSVKKKFYVLLVGGSLVGSSLFGFGGAYLANQILNNSNTANQNSSTVLYQSVLRTNTDNSATDKMSLEDVVINVKNSVVEIVTETVSNSNRMGQYVTTGAGSGVVISDDGYIVTNNHVVDGASTITVTLSDGNKYQAILVGTDSKTDLAVIKIDATNLQAAILGYSSDLLVGQSAVAIGNPLGELGGTVTSGIISALDREITIDGETMSLLQTDVSINPGNSGGGLFNLYGELIGIVNAKSSGSEIEGLGFAIPIDTVKEVVEQLIENGYVKGRVSMGLTLIDIQDAQVAAQYQVSQLGLYIYESKNSSFKSGDRIISVDDETISTLSQLKKLLNSYSVGETINVVVERNSKTVTVNLTLTELIS